MIPAMSVSRDSDYSSFEIVDEPQDATNSGRSPAPRRNKNWAVVLATCFVLAVGGAGFAFLVIDGDDEDEPSSEESDTETTGFEPYGGGSVSGDEGDQVAAPAPSDPEPSDSSADREESDFPDSPSEAQERTRPLNRDDIDGEQVVEDSRGEAISQREAQERLKREVESMENLDEDFQRRLRQRDVEQTSRVLQRRDGRMETTPGIEASEELQYRLREQFGERRQEPEGVSAEDYRGPAADDDFDDEYYDDEYYDDEYFDDEYYDDEYYDEYYDDYDDF